MKIIGKKIIHYPEVDSTNDQAKRLIKEGMDEGVVIIADSQSKGRGKPGKGWFSPAGVGIYLSSILRPFQNPPDLAPIILLGARAVVSAVREVSGLKATLKHPNDVLLKGKKICGILVERVASGHLIIGMGVNLNNSIASFPEDLRKQATSLQIESNQKYNLQEFIHTLISELDKEYLAYLANI